MKISHYGFVSKVTFSNEKYISVKKRKKRKKEGEKKYFRYSQIICELFPLDKYYSYSYSPVLTFTNYSSYYSYLREK